MAPSDVDPTFKGQKLLIANRGEIAYRILKTAKRLGIPSVAIFTLTDSTAPHVLYAEESVLLRPDDADATSNSRGYLDGDAIVEIAKQKGCTLLAPGYGFLSENEEFAASVAKAGITWLGPDAKTIHDMGLKHISRDVAIKAKVPVVPGSQGLVAKVDDAVKIANEIGFPVMLKATGGGGGMGIVVCSDEASLRANFEKTQDRAQTLFKNDGLFLERFVPASRHVEVQVFGDGQGHVIHFGERECSVQRRRQKVIEETPSPFMLKHPDIRNKMCESAARMCADINYTSAGTCEFLVDDKTGEYFFLELNARLQVEHTITEAVNPGLDLVELMIRQGIAQRNGNGGLPKPVLDQAKYGAVPKGKHAVELRIYVENPSKDFQPAPGLLQEVSWPKSDWLRVDGWVDRGSQISPFYDPLAAKLIVSGSSRDEAISRTVKTLKASKLYGPPNNIDYLLSIVQAKVFAEGNALTTYLDQHKFVPRAFDVLKPGVATTVQDVPGRLTGFGVPHSGAMDDVAHRVANLLVGNPPGMETLEVTVQGPRLLFHVAAVVAVTGAEAKVKLSGSEMPLWAAFEVPAGSTLEVMSASKTGHRLYIAVRGGFPGVPAFLGSKATSFAIGGYQGRPLSPGDQLSLTDGCGPSKGEKLPLKLPTALIPTYPTDFTVFVTSGPHDDEEYLKPEGIEEFYETSWKVSTATNRMGIRLEGPKLKWARPEGGAGGAHPSNVLDTGYAYGTVNINGDNPVLLTAEGPSMGGYCCVCTVATSDLWKLGQLRPGSTLRFQRITLKDAAALHTHVERWIHAVGNYIKSGSSTGRAGLLDFKPESSPTSTPRLAVIEAEASSGRPRVIFRQAGDRYLLIEYGEEELDLTVRARIHLFELEVKKAKIKGVVSLAPCVRSTLCLFEPESISQEALVRRLVEIEQGLPANIDDVVFPGRLLTFPTVFDDRWSKDAIAKYMKSSRDKAAYLPSNVEYLAENNGLDGGAKSAIEALGSSDWIAVGVGFYLGCPFLVPIDPRKRLTGSKYNPSRTYTPRGALGVAGPIAAIYPVESPGGYQLYARTLPPWQTWGKGADFDPERPWLLRFFDQLRFKPVSPEEYEQLERSFDAGTYRFDIQDKPFKMSEYKAFVDSVKDETAAFRKKQAEAIAKTGQREAKLLKEWEEEKAKEAASGGSSSSAQVNDSGPAIEASMNASIWKIKVKPGDVIKSVDDVVVVLEAMKSEIDVAVEEEEFVGKKVKALAVKEGDVISAGQKLVIFE